MMTAGRQVPRVPSVRGSARSAPGAIAAAAGNVGVLLTVAAAMTVVASVTASLVDLTSDPVAMALRGGTAIGRRVMTGAVAAQNAPIPVEVVLRQVPG